MKFVYDFGEGAEREDLQDISNCLDVIFSTPRGSVPMARGLGISWHYLSEVPEELESDVAADMLEEVEEWENRVVADEVTFSHEEGESQGTITFAAAEG